MNKVFIATILASLLSVGCTTQNKKISATSQDTMSQQALAELKRGISIYFDKNSSQIETRYHPYLVVASKSLAQNKNLVLELEGHTDNTGSIATNKRVSLERANAVRNKLVMEYNVSPSQLIAIGAGPLKPLDSNNTAEGRANNRRVTATLKIR